MNTYIVVHTPIKHARDGGPAEIYEPGEPIELTVKDARRLGDNVRPKGKIEESSEHEEKTVAELTAMLEEKGVEVPPKTRKAELIEMVKATEDRGPTTAE